MITSGDGLFRRVPRDPIGPEGILDAFLEWVAERGLALYDAQERAILELLADRHVVLGTPTGSGKSLVATFLHFMALSRGRLSVYTSPTKALASEKFFRLCADFGPERVGMLTGDASINRDAPILCCTAEILANLALRQGRTAGPSCVVMDEFHYYSDADRGTAWQIPLIVLADTQFLLMSATLGDTSDIEAHVRNRSGREIVNVTTAERPVPLDYTWRETPLQTTVAWLQRGGRLPAYVVHFTHRECAETAQALTSLNLCTRLERQLLSVSLHGFSFDTPFGRELERLLRAGIAVHHAGMLPKYRLLVEQLAQQGRLKIICGTDTLGVGVNIPIRTVLFARLAKYDGARTRILAARDFRQIAGRAGRKGFDDMGSVVCQAPEDVVEALRKPGESTHKRRRRQPRKGKVVWNRQTFEQLIVRQPERMASRFRVTHGMIVNALARTASAPGEPRGFHVVADLVNRCHERDESKSRLRREAAQLFRDLRRAGLVTVNRGLAGGPPSVSVSPDLQEDFSLHETLSLYLVDAVAALDHEGSTFAMDVVSVVEAVVEDPRPILEAQQRRARAEALARMKAAGVPYEDRAALLEAVVWPQPLAEYVLATFDAFARRHPWVGEGDVSPKSIAREMLDEDVSFNEYVVRYGLQRSEGLLLRHLAQVYKALDQTVPRYDKTDDVLDATYALRTVVAQVDDSLPQEWARMLAAESGTATSEVGAATRGDLVVDDRRRNARVRAEMQALVRALAAGRYEDAERCIQRNPDDPWDAERFELAMRRFRAQRGRLVVEPRTRKREHTLLRQIDRRVWLVRQVLVDEGLRCDWAVYGRLDLRVDAEPAGPLVRVHDVGP